MKPGPAWHVPGLTGIRALAALWVLVHHFNAVVGWRPLHLDLAGTTIDLTPLATCGWVGVDIFFVLSGFLLTRQLLGALEDDSPRQSTRRYYLHRVLRVYPAYLAQIALLALVAWVATGPPAWLEWVPLHVAMMQGASAAGNAAINPVYWTLTVEFWFYGLLPFAVAFLRRGGPGAELGRAAGIFAISMVVSIAWRGVMFFLGHDGPVELLDWSFRQLPGGLELFGAGHLAAVVCRALERRQAPTDSRRSGALILIGLASLVGLLYVLHWNIDTYWSGSPLLFVWQSLAALAVALLVAGVALDGTLSRLAFANAPALYLGEISYSIYLWHFPAALALAKILPPSRNEPAFLAIAFIATIALSALSHRCIERPALARRHYWEQFLLGRPGARPP